jgi:hypothetical protein
MPLDRYLSLCQLLLQRPVPTTAGARLFILVLFNGVSAWLLLFLFAITYVWFIQYFCAVVTKGCNSNYGRGGVGGSGVLGG